jgi:uncharacterized phage protein gp47/JayE
MTTSVPAIAFNPTGLVLPQESAILAGAQADLSGAFGGNLNPALNTPQGQLATSLTAVIADANATFALYVNQIDPDTASGFMQDAIARIYFLNRSPGAPTAVECTCVGLFGTVIPVGAQAQDTSGNRYVCTLGGTIAVSGSVSLPFANLLDGPTPCPAGTLTTIYQAVLGWESITNPADGVIGANVETQAAFAYRRTQSVALNAHGSLASIYAAVFDVENVIDVYVTENFTNAAVVAGSTAYSLAPHSLYVAAIGGASADIAQAIFSQKDVGCDMNGNTSVVVTDLSGYLPPYPTYTITYEIPAALPILFAVQISASATLPSNIVQLTQNAIIAAFTGADGSQPVRIGSLLLASKFYAPIVALGAEVSVISILLGSSSPTLTSQLIGIDQKPTIAAGNIAVTLV